MLIIIAMIPNIFDMKEISDELAANLPPATRTTIRKDSISLYWCYIKPCPTFVEEASVSITITPQIIWFAGASYPQNDPEDCHIYASKSLETLEGI